MSANDGEVIGLTLLWGDGNVGKHYNIVIVAEGYQASELDRFASDATAVLTKFKTSEPFASSMGALNVFRLDVASTMSGADDEADGTHVDTYFDAYFDAVTPRLLCVNDSLVESTVSTAIQNPNGTAAPVHKILVIVNTSQDGGSGGTTNGIAVSASGLASSSSDVYERTVLHEMGHAFGLCDEYPNETTSMIRLKKAITAVATPDIMPNLSTTYQRDSLPQPWRSLLTPGVPLPTVWVPGDPPLSAATVGAFPVDDSGYYVPQWSCTMQDSREPYCVVCATWIGSQLETLK